MWVVCVLPEYSFVCEFFSMERVCVCITMCAWEKKKGFILDVCDCAFGSWTAEDKHGFPKRCVEKKRRSRISYFHV